MYEIFVSRLLLGASLLLEGQTAPFNLIPDNRVRRFPMRVTRTIAVRFVVARAAHEVQLDVEEVIIADHIQGEVHTVSCTPDELAGIGSPEGLFLADAGATLLH